MGGTLSSGTFGPEWAAPQTVFLQPGYVNPWAGFCNGECFESGISGAAYLFFDALINGDGSGYDNSENWPIGFVNYLFEPIAFFALGGGATSSSSESQQWLPLCFSKHSGVSAATRLTDDALDDGAGEGSLEASRARSSRRRLRP